MMPSRPCARAKAASKSRYFWTRLSSKNTRRIASVEKISRNTAESISDVGISAVSGTANLRGLFIVHREEHDHWVGADKAARPKESPMLFRPRRVHASNGKPTYCSASDAWACVEACR